MIEQALEGSHPSLPVDVTSDLHRPDARDVDVRDVAVGDVRPTAYHAGEGFYLPRMLYLLPAQIHPETDALVSASATWVRDRLAFAFATTSDTEDFIAQQTGAWACHVYPTGEAARVFLACRMLEFVSAFDDAMIHGLTVGPTQETVETLFPRLLDVLGGVQGMTLRSPWEVVFRDLLDELRCRCSSAQWSRFTAHFTTYLQDCAVGVHARDHEAVLDLASYFQVRRGSIGMGMALVLGEYVVGVDLGESLARSDRLGRVADLVLEHAMLANDLFSFRTEADDDEHLNYLAVLILSQGKGLDEAAFELVEAIEARRAAFMRERWRLRSCDPTLSDDERIYLDALWDMMAGNVSWSYLTTRYHGASYTWGGELEGWLQLNPQRTDWHPVPFRSRPW